MAEPSLASTAVFAVSDDQVGAEKIGGQATPGRSFGEKLLSQKPEFKPLSSVPTLRQFGSAAYQL
jgi:hypothetical protein